MMGRESVCWAVQSTRLIDIRVPVALALRSTLLHSCWAVLENICPHKDMNNYNASKPGLSPQPQPSASHSYNSTTSSHISFPIPTHFATSPHRAKTDNPCEDLKKARPSGNKSGWKANEQYGGRLGDAANQDGDHNKGCKCVIQ
ncbi:hypothetical protein D9619_007975 [Psilocybe cf. subviscida]|uniref:Uncharacterized protein n=1 Tax=Psilocybe cf. subviscida TaxID=2480587 RepID=A0A8H5ESD2_9AGAR|nr:hypothetical protein D9619_007975 [Psilocybe cf. subviscida]